ncbi:MAG: dihydropteroate synthase [Chlorobiota bacterium]|jgi:dihydropteroate synthase|nr:dihydropteroate synthase [Chlorobiota bacterium]QQS66992.1 MAG: dihydropteroate synthase [Chlorobiota bacterium]
MNYNEVKIMGILNCTPDSFYDGGEYFSVDKAVTQAVKLINEGAHIIDIGGESTRPPGNDYGTGSEFVPIEVELSRVLPVIEKILSIKRNAIISIDTFKPEVAEKAILVGACIINDVSAGTYNETIWKVASKFQVPYILMHGFNPSNRKSNQEYFYSNIVNEVFEFLLERINSARSAGVKEIIADVGFGFSKGFNDNLTLLKNYKIFSNLGVATLVGLSRKSLIGKMLNDSKSDRLYGSIAANYFALKLGAKIIRVHDVKATKDFLEVSRILDN